MSTTNPIRFSDGSTLSIPRERERELYDLLSQRVDASRPAGAASPVAIAEWIRSLRIQGGSGAASTIEQLARIIGDAFVSGSEAHNAFQALVDYYADLAQALSKRVNERREKYQLAFLHAGVAPAYALRHADMAMAACDGNPDEIERLQREVASLEEANGAFAAWERAYEETIPEVCSADGIRKRFGQLVSIVTASLHGTGSFHFAATLAHVRDDLIPMLRKAGAIPSAALVDSGQRRGGELLAADRVQERALEAEGACIRLEQEHEAGEVDYRTLEWKRAVAKELRRIERELRGEPEPVVAAPAERPQAAQEFPLQAIVFAPLQPNATASADDLDIPF